MAGYFVFDRASSGKQYLSKIAYILTDLNSNTKDCYNSFVEDMKGLFNAPDSAKDNLSTWKRSSYTVQIGKGKFKNYTGSDKNTIAILFKYKAPAKSSQSSTQAPKQNTKQTSKQSVTSSAKKADYKIVKDYRWHSYYYYEGLVLKNTSDTTKDYDVKVMFYDDKNNLIGVGNYSADVVGSGQLALIKCSNETHFHHMEYSITAQDSRYHEIQSIVDVQVSIVDKKAIIMAKNKGNVAAKFVEYDCLFINNKGKVVDSSWGYLVDSNSELKPGMSEFCERTCYEPFNTVEVYYSGRY